MKREKTQFIKLIQVWGVLFLVGLGVSIVIVDVISSYRDFNKQAIQMRTDFIEVQKQIIKQEVNRVVEMIRYEKAQSERLTKEKIKTMTYMAYSIAQNIYQQNQIAEDKVKIQQMILDALRPIRFENKKGYYFATRLDGVEMLFADRPQMEGLNLIDMQDTRGKSVIKDMIELVNQSGEGFYEYHWTKPESKGNDFKKISFIKRVEPFDWFVGTGLYVDDIENQIKQNLVSAISRIRFGKEGYIFINRFNGDALVSNGKHFSGTKKLWEEFNENSEKMKNIFEKEYNAALKPDGDYIYYSWFKLNNSQEESPKASFIYGIPDLQWIVGAGFYLDDVEANIRVIQTELNNQIKQKVLYFVLITISIFTIFFLFYFWLNQQLKKDFTHFISFFKRAAHTDDEINRDNIKFDELDQMAAYANIMLTDRKQTEDKLRASLEREKFWADVIRIANVGIVVGYPDGRLGVNNAAYRKITGYSENELKEINWNKVLTPHEWIEPETAKMEELHQTKKPVVYEKEYIRKDGSKIPIELMVHPGMDNDGNINCYYAFITDITDRKRAEKERLKLEKDLMQSQKMESIGKLAGGIAHDFNNILSSILGFSELALEEVEKGSTMGDNLQEIYAGGLRAKEIVDHILAFARQSDQRLEPTRVDDIVIEAFKLIRPSIPATIEIRKEIESSSLVMGNATQIHQIIMNLCTNAAHAMQDDGGIMEVTLKDVLFAEGANIPVGIEKGKYLELTISDTGCGIETEYIDSIFDPYFTTKDTGQGTGMGLATVRGIVDSYGGTITVESTPCVKTIFTIYLPITSNLDNKIVDATETPPKGDEHILFVDDEPSIARMGSRILESLGYQVTTRTSSIEALELFKENPGDFQLVITDMTMPHMNGDKFAIELRQIRTDIPIILCTGYSSKINAEIAQKIGINAFTSKPFLKSDLACTTREVLDNNWTTCS